MTIDQIVQLGIFVGTVLAAAYTYITSRNTKQRLKPIEQHAAEHSQTMKEIKTDTDAVDKRVQELESDKEMLEEARAARDCRIDSLEAELKVVHAQVQTLTGEKAEVVRDRDRLQTMLVNAENEIQKLNIRIIKLEAQSEAEKNANERIVKPIVEALASLALQPHDTGRLNPAKLDHAPDAHEKPAA